MNEYILKICIFFRTCDLVSASAILELLMMNLAVLKLQSVNYIYVYAFGMLILLIMFLKLYFIILYYICSQ